MRERASPTLQPPSSALLARGDRSKLIRALGNVLSNAYKYSPQGGAVEIAFPASPDGAPRAGVCVRDHGIGMTPEQLSRVCERFYCADASGSIPGTGLGMSLVKEIVELLGGSIEVTSRFGEGTEVTLWLPRTGGGDAEERPPRGEVSCGSSSR